MPELHTVEQPAELLAFLFVRHPDVKRTKVRQWLEHGSVQVNGRSITRTRHQLRSGDRVSIRAKAEVLAEGQLPPGMKVLFEDQSLVVVEKPEKLLSVATATERVKTAYAFLTEYVRRGNPKNPNRVWIVHRLDRETSGLMVFAKTESAKRALQAHWHETEKRYLAVVEGNPPEERGVLGSHLDLSRSFKVKSTAPNDRTRRAVTHYRVMKRIQNHTLVELTLETGRRNQIRVHLAEAKCPVVGDHKYEARTNPAKRLGLHASLLAFKHPLTGETLRFESRLPADLARLL